MRLRGLLLAATISLIVLTLVTLFPSVAVSASGVGEKPRYTVMTAVSPTLGTYLTDGRGNTLYFSTADLPDVSNCNSGCLTVWPPFFAEALSVAPPLHAADFGAIVRDKGRRQVTYRGWPLYYYSRDWAPHDTNGQGLYGQWYVVQPALLGPPSK